MSYAYDSLGRLAGVVDGTGHVAKYSYDAVGNLLSITRETSTSTPVLITSVSPGHRQRGQHGDRRGHWFREPQRWSASDLQRGDSHGHGRDPTRLTALVPTGATTGSITVTVGSDSFASGTVFAIDGTEQPSISGLSTARRIEPPSAVAR